MRRLNRTRLLGVAVLSALALVLAASALPAFAASTPSYTKESKEAYEQQLSKGEIASATFNKRIRSLRLTLKNGQYYLYKYPKKGSAPLIKALKEKHVSVTVLTPAEGAAEAKPAKHKLRYIAGGVLILVIVIVGVVLIVNRRRERD